MCLGRFYIRSGSNFTWLFELNLKWLATKGRILWMLDKRSTATSLVEEVK